MFFTFFLGLGGSKRDKMIDINNYIKAVFLDVRSKRGIVHDDDLRGWAVRRSREVKYNMFCLFLLFYF